MICPQQHFQALLNQNNNNNTINHRNSICFELSGCSTDESSTDDYPLIKSSSNRYWPKPIRSTMNDINEHEIFPSTQPPTIIEESNIHPDNEDEQEEKGMRKKECATVNHYICLYILVQLITK